MNIIDAHMHFSSIKRFENTAKSISNVNYSSIGLDQEYKNCNISLGIGMGITETMDKTFPDATAITPMGLDLEETVPSFIKYCIGINPNQITNATLLRVEDSLKKDSVVGIKLYPGYYPVHVFDNVYTPVFELAQQFDVPIVIHGGNVYSYRGHLKYSHPLNVNDVAVKFKKLSFIIAHLGDPWVIDTTTVIANNDNVYADLSGIIVGDEKKITDRMNEKLFIDNIKRGLVYTDCYHKLLFGTDWPLVQIKPYIKFIKSLIPEDHYEKIFYKNALNVFKRLNN